jgi:hypothetical protein
LFVFHLDYCRLKKSGRNVVKGIATKFVLSSLLVLASVPSPLLAQESVLRTSFSFDGVVDCSRPLAVKNFGLHGEGTAVLYSDRRATLDYTQRGLSSTQVRFDAKLGGAPSPAPGGTASLRVISRSQLRGVWSLPNNDLILTISVARNSCTARLDTRLKGGAREYSLYDSGMLVYCSRPRIGPVSCQAR